jgi:Phosphotransferase enzyme family
MQLDLLGRESTGAFDQIHDRPWSTVIQVPTLEGNVFFKAGSPPLRHEAALTELLGMRRPDCIPPPLAIDSVRGWMLLEDGGQTLRRLIEIERDLSRWKDVLPLYAGVQIDVAEDVPALLAIGVPDFRTGSLPAQLEALLDEIEDQPDEERRRLQASLPWVREACAELSDAGLPETIQHDDLHDAQVFVRHDRYLLLDWGDACISHPFFTLAVTLDGVIAWGVDDVEASEPTEPYRDAYLQPFKGLGTGDLVALAQTARRLGWVCRALNSRRSQPSDESTRLRLRMFLDGHP